MVRSAGVIVYKRVDGDIFVLLCHPGGPFWKDKYIHAWSIPKGELNSNESVVSAAKREFKEETSLSIKSPLKFLGSHKVSNTKLVIMFYTECDYKIDNCFSNKFMLEYPKGVFHEYPEMDEYEWVRLDDAYSKIFKNQIYFLDKLKEEVLV